MLCPEAVGDEAGVAETLVSGLSYWLGGWTRVFSNWESLSLGEPSSMLSEAVGDEAGAEYLVSGLSYWLGWWARVFSNE